LVSLLCYVLFFQNFFQKKNDSFQVHVPAHYVSNMSFFVHLQSWILNEVIVAAYDQ
jgi:hypothetical protein